MRNNETGEFEMVLGNKQLLSGFFVVVILFGVFFTMGYIVGRNSAPAAQPAETAAAPPAAAAPQQASAMPPAAAEAAKPAEGQPAESGPQPTTQPAQDTAAAAPPAAAPPKPAEAEPLAPVEPVAGATYLQVMAVQRAEAEVVVRTLREKGLPAIMAPGPKDLLRVLVGPYTDATALGQAKAKLQNAGFDAFVRK
ncbi:MAG: SPOR domain-containing protein [Bryobacteraceae bacterium]